MCLFKNKAPTIDPVEERFNIIIDLVKDLDRSNYNRLKAAMDLGYDAYQKVRNVRTVEEKEVADIVKAEVALSKEEK